jgi:hypothetical protein
MAEAINLKAKRAKIIAEHQAMQKHHAHWQEEAKKGRLLGEFPVVFSLDDEVLILAEDMPKIMAGLKQFTEQRAKEYSKRKSEPEVALMLSKVESILANPPTGDFRVRSQVWNCLSHALADVGLECSMADGSDMLTP